MVFDCYSITLDFTTKSFILSNSDFEYAHDDISYSTLT